MTVYVSMLAILMQRLGNFHNTLLQTSSVGSKVYCNATFLDIPSGYGIVSLKWESLRSEMGRLLAATIIYYIVVVTVRS